MRKDRLRELNGFTAVLLMLFCFLTVNESAADIEDVPVRIGIPKDSDFYYIDDNGAISGYGCEYIEFISKVSGLKFDFIHGENMNECLSMLQKGEIDILNGVIFTPARSRIYDYTDYQTGIVFGQIFAQKNNTKMVYGEFKSMNDIKIGLLFGGWQNRSFFEYANKNNLTHTSIIYKDTNSLSAALQKGEVNAIVLNNMYFSENEKPIARFSPRPFYFVTKKGNTKLLDRVNNAISQILVENPNFNSNLVRKHFPNDTTALILSEEEKIFIKNSDVITVVYDKLLIPFRSDDYENNEAVIDINADILRLISEKTGLKFKFVEGRNYEECIKLVAQGKADMILNYDAYYKTLKLNNIILSDTFLSTPIVILGFEKSIEQNSIFAIPRKYDFARKYVEDYYPKNKIIVYGSIEDCLTAIERGEATFTFENVHMANKVIREGNYSGLSIVTVATLMDNIPFALRHDIDENIVRIINKAINSISSSELERVLYKHLISKPNVTFSIFYSHNKLLIFTLASIFLAILSVAFGVTILIQIKSRKSVWRMAYIDQLTGIGNLNKFKIDAEYLLKKNHNTTYVIEKLDIDRFKFINELYSFLEGDLVLKDLSKSIEFIMNKDKDTYARVGSDEFVILKSYKLLEQIEKSRIVFENKFFEIHAKNNMHIKFPTGRYVIERGETDITKIFEKVNYAHRLAKQQKGNMVCLYDDKIKTSALYAREIESKMEIARDEQKFLVHLQPKYFLRDNSIIGAEALVRWESEEGKLIHPGKFISLFEQNGFILKLDFYMVERVCEVIRSWINEGIEPVAVSVNFSRLHLLDHISFLRKLCEVVDRHGIPRYYIEIEFTESVIFNNEEVFTDIFIRLNNAGFAISMDDFGTGYSSLGMLKNIPVDVIKMDKSFFTNSNDPERSEIVISHIMLMAKNLDISTIAEGVETEEQIEMLKKVGCDIAQGYFYSKPLCVKDFTALLKSR